MATAEQTVTLEARTGTLTYLTPENEGVPAWALNLDGVTVRKHAHISRSDMAGAAAWALRALKDVAVPFDPGTGPIPGYVAGVCGHRVARSEWHAGFRICERCPDLKVEDVDGETMTVRVVDRGTQVGYVYPSIRTVTIPTTCPKCGMLRGKPYAHRFAEDGDWLTCDRWDNPCGHTDSYGAVLVEAGLR